MNQCRLDKEFQISVLQIRELKISEANNGVLHVEFLLLRVKTSNFK
jgi:hypothetical protein